VKQRAAEIASGSPFHNGEETMMTRLIGIAALLGAIFASVAYAQNTTLDEIARYRAQLQDGNPAELWEARGEDLWKQKRGPKQVSLEQCDLGKGRGVVKGAYAELPRYFSDADKVMDLESRLLHCMVTLQGFSRADATKRVFGSGSSRSDFEALAAWITAESKGVVMKVSLNHQKMQEAYELGEKAFYFRGGPHDFSCATCHGEDNKRIRLQDLPNLTQKKGAQLGYTTWPAYRVSQGELRTFQWRLNDCFRQQRFPDLVFGSELSIALTAFLAYNANGAAYNAPAIKR
jgi:sulfur-oxidizing protein SoxA